MNTDSESAGNGIKSDQQLEMTQERVFQFQQQVARIRQTATDTENYHLSAVGFLAEIDRMNLEIRDYLWSDPAKRPLTPA